MAKYGVLVMVCICYLVASETVLLKKFNCEKKLTCTDKKPDSFKECYNKLTDKYKEAITAVEECDGNFLFENPDAFFCKEKDDEAYACYEKITDAIDKVTYNLPDSDRNANSAYQGCLSPLYERCGVYYQENYY